MRRRSSRAKRCARLAPRRYFCAARGHLGLDCAGRSDDTPVVNRARRWLGILAVLCAVVGVYARPAQAAPVSARELRARQDFAAGRYEEAIEIFAELYAKTADPIFLRNIARCYQKQNRADEAIANFREYLSKAKKLSPGEREEIEGFIRDLEASRAPPKPAEPATAAASSRAHAGADRSAAARRRTPAGSDREHAAVTGERSLRGARPAKSRRARRDESPRTQVRAKAEPAPARWRLGVGAGRGAHRRRRGRDRRRRRVRPGGAFGCHMRWRRNTTPTATAPASATRPCSGSATASARRRWSPA